MSEPKYKLMLTLDEISQLGVLIGKEKKEHAKSRAAAVAANEPEWWATWDKGITALAQKVRGGQLV